MRINVVVVKECGIGEGGERVSGTFLKGVKIYDAEKEIKKNDKS